jgi:hypothetical protein
MMTTVEISDALAREAKELATRGETTLREFIEAGLRIVLRERALPKQSAVMPFVIPAKAGIHSQAPPRLDTRLRGYDGPTVATFWAKPREWRRKAGFRLRDASFGGNGRQAEFRGADWERLRETAYEGRGT